ncbi:hypothetical protein PAXINDRAFT_89809 [Paxillus involutus ATCC 200175]|uniref:Uncharacterized protein n=1 Tax=Paxillus involutus ATCC 200175 TaxID=664439 RepID=A0A0C9T9N0_PAXIN|nr:hypothetical protein PAXINDRAFT_89809 [Paxillus involutus ATCC 200175]
MDTETKLKLHKLQAYLNQLPDSLPLKNEAESDYGFDFFGLGDTDEEDLGLEGAVNRQLEIRLGQRNKGPVRLKERGSGIAGVISILDNYLTELPTSIILKKWVDDLISSAELAFETAKCPLPEISGTGTPVVQPSAEDSNPEDSEEYQQPKKKIQKVDSKVLTSFDDPNYQDLLEMDDNRGKGIKILPLLLKVSRRCQKKNLGAGDSKPERALTRCIGSRGCNTIWAFPRNRQRVLAHTSKCNWLPSDVREAALEHLGGNAVGPAAIISPDSTVSHRAATKSQIDNTVTVTTHQKAGQTGSGSSNTMFKSYVTEGRQELKDKVDYAVMRFIVCCGIPPTTVDSDEFKTMVTTLNPRYPPPSSSTLTAKLIPNEAAKISLATKNYLATCRHLTITFDGGKTRQPHSVYSIHVTTADRRTFCVELDDASRLSHTGEYIFEALDQIRTILAFMSRSSYAMEHFDHKRHLLGIARGLEAIGDTRFGTLYWAGRSIQRGLPAFRAIIEQESLGISIGSLNELFTEGYSKLTFEFELSKLLSAIGPWVKALKCLESAHITADTIYFYWLAIMAQLEEDLKKNSYGMRVSTIEDIRAIANSRFNEMIEDAPNDTYVVAFFLNPAYRIAPIYKDQNPLAVPSVSINQKKGETPTITTKPPNNIIECVGLSLQRMLKHEYGDAYQNRNWVDPKKQMSFQNPMLAKYHPMDALDTLKDQLKAYAKGAEPFNRRLRPKTESTADWWAAVQQDEDGGVLGALALKIFSAVPISMADERTMSTITWLNSPRRSAQGVGTLQDHIKIRQWHRYKPEVHFIFTFQSLYWLTAVIGHYRNKVLPTNRSYTGETWR